MTNQSIFSARAAIADFVIDKTVMFDKTHRLHLLDSCILMRIIPAVMCGSIKIILLEINFSINKKLKFHGQESKYHYLDYQEKHK